MKNETKPTTKTRADREQGVSLAGHASPAARPGFAASVEDLMPRHRCAECGQYETHAALCPYAPEPEELEEGAEDLPEDDPRDFLFDELHEENLL